MGLSRDLAEVLREHQRRAAPLIDQIRTTYEGARHAYRVAPVDLGADPDAARSLIIALVDAAVAARKSHSGIGRFFAKPVIPDYPSFPPGSRTIQVLKSLGRHKPAYTRADAAILLELLNSALADHLAREEWILIDLVPQPLAAAERAVKDSGVGELREPIGQAAEALGRFSGYSVGAAARARARFLALLGAADSEIPPDLIVPGETWGEKWRPRIRGADRELQALVIHLPLAGSVVPTAAWRKRTAALTGAAAGPMLREMLTDAMSSRSTKVSRAMQFDDRTYVIAEPNLVNPNVLVLRGAIWAAAAIAEPWVMPLLGEVGAYFGSSGRSDNVARDERLAGSAAAALGTIGSVEA